MPKKTARQLELHQKLQELRLKIAKNKYYESITDIRAQNKHKTMVCDASTMCIVDDIYKTNEQIEKDIEHEYKLTHL